MDRATAINLSRRLLHRITTNTTDETAGPATDTADAFLSAERWQLERERLFFDTPQVIGFAGEVAEPGSFLTTESMSIPIVVTRDEKGVLRAFINACGHRGARVAQGCGVKKRLTCKFHGWSYGLDGQLAGRPQQHAFSRADKESVGLVPLPVSDNAGLIVVGLRPGMDQQRVDHALDEIAPAFTGFNFDRVHTVETRRFEVAANWKLVASLSHESYHFATLHRDSLAPVMTANAVVDEFGSHTRWGFPLRDIVNLNELEETQWPDRPPAAFNHTLFPGTVVITPQRDAQMIRVEPGSSPGHSVVYYSGVCDDKDTLEESRESYAFGGTIFETEDLPMAEQCQQGLAAGQPSVVFGRNEPIVQYWHKLWDKALTQSL